ncbi:hypothetical protein M6I34_12705 [Burkholderiaceae bacterium FT117]|uniref:hypothetical protein n=1 Tax=Zeimonas sediminis TaxID=2944268 RepID=UPI0023431A53|nr:hypothetical protein [Zeimonas sediminis]MCM5571371.1 hypothetical protein [Zeimonas sediminis]
MQAPVARSPRLPIPFTLIAIILAAFVALSGCSPRYDWREIRADEDGYLAMMPDRPDRLTLPIDLDGMAVQMAMQGARIDGVAFVVGAVRLPDASVAVRERALAAMRSAMVRNIGGREAGAEAIAVPVVDPSGRATGSAPGWRIRASGRAGDREVAMHAVFASREGRAWQAVVLGPDPDPEQARTFLDGFRILE